MPFLQRVLVVNMPKQASLLSDEPNQISTIKRSGMKAILIPMGATLEKVIRAMPMTHVALNDSRVINAKAIMWRVCFCWEL